MSKNDKISKISISKMSKNDKINKSNFNVNLLKSLIGVSPTNNH